MRAVTFLGDEEIGDRALELLLSEPVASRQALVRWAAAQFSRCDLGDPSSVDPRQFVADAIWDNPMLADWMRARRIDSASVRCADSFVDLIDRLTPTFGDS